MPRTSIYRTSDPGRVTFAGRMASAPTATPDSGQLDAAQLRRIQDWMRVLNELETSTNELLAERTARMTGATVMAGKHHSRWFRVPEPASGCPALGPLALSWQDIFDETKANLRALVAARPPRWSSGNDVVRWVRAVRWNVILLQDATNIRPVFRWPNDPPDVRGWMGDEESSRGSQTTLLNRTGGEGRSSPHGVYADQTPPLVVSRELAVVAARYPDVQSFRDDVWWTAFDWDFAWTTLGSFVRLYMLSPRTGPYPGQVVDMNPDRFARGSTPSLPNAIDRYWRDLQPVKLTYGPRDIATGGVWMEGVYFHPGKLVDEYVAIATGFAALDLPTMILDSIGFYVYNHLPYWRSRGVIALDDTTIQRIQANAASARMRQGLAPSGIVASIASSVNPVVGAVVSALQEIGFALLDTMLNQQLESDQPRRLFVRNYPSSCIGLEDTELSLGSEEAVLGGALTAREAQLEADRRAAAALEETTQELRETRARRESVPWKEIAVGVGVAAVIGTGIWALSGGNRT